MTGKMKTVGLDPEVHKELKLLCAQKGWTMTQAVAHMIKVLEETEGKEDAKRGGGDDGSDVR